MVNPVGTRSSTMILVNPDLGEHHLLLIQDGCSIDEAGTEDGRRATCPNR